MRRLLWLVLGLLVLLAAVGLIGAGWYYSDELLPAAEVADPVYDVDVLTVDGDTMTLRAGDGTAAWEREDLLTDGIFGFATASGYVHLTEVTDRSGDQVTRRFEVVDGSVRRGTRGDVQAYAYPDDPEILGRPYDDVAVPGALGDYPAWRFPGEGNDWVVFVHGRGATRAESLRAVDHVVDLGMNALVISYRNDPDAPASPDGHGHYGDSEWQDLESAVTWLLETHTGVDDVLLWGFSQGGGVVASYLRQADVPDPVVAAVLDSPILSMHATLRLQAMNRDVPRVLLGPILSSAIAISELRSDLDFDRLEHLDAAAEFTTPILLFHGRDDTTVPFEPADAFARARPDLVTFVPYDGEHVRGWNVINEDYLEAVSTFLAPFGD